jgi:hypothetical protein
MEVSARRNFLVGGLGKTDQAGVTPGETTGLLDEERIWAFHAREPEGYLYRRSMIWQGLTDPAKIRPLIANGSPAFQIVPELTPPGFYFNKLPRCSTTEC